LSLKEFSRGVEPGCPVPAAAPARGFTIPELLVVLALCAVVLTLTVTYAIRWLGRVESRGAAFTIESFLQRARMEAVSRNRDCRFTVDTATRRVRVIDLMDPADTGDDLVVADATLSTKVDFARPDFGSPVTLTFISGTTYGATFASDGSLAAGTGLVSLLGGDGFLRVSLYGAGGASVEQWDGSNWVAP
jgi:prepilin-type N-terminal cleavage/methylation domain-containing protein